MTQDVLSQKLLLHKIYLCYLNSIYSLSLSLYHIFATPITIAFSFLCFTHSFLFPCFTYHYYCSFISLLIFISISPIHIFIQFLFALLITISITFTFLFWTYFHLFALFIIIALSLLCFIYVQTKKKEDYLREILLDKILAEKTRKKI